MKNAYFTVEAALVFPIVLCVILSTVYLFIFQFNRCLFEQDISMFLLYAGTVPADSMEELQGLITDRITDRNEEKYVSWNTDELNVIISGSKVTLEGSGMMPFPFSGWKIMGNEVWYTTVNRSVERLSPVEYIRLKEKIVGGK